MGLLKKRSAAHSTSVDLTFHDPGSTGRWRAFSFTSVALRLAWYLLLHKVDVVHFNLASRGSTMRKIILARFCDLFDTPYVLHLHGAEYRKFFGSQPKFVRARIQRLFQRASCVLVLGNGWAEFVADELGVQPSRTAVLANAADGPRRAKVPSGQDPGVIFLGRLDERKGLPTLIEALEGLNDLASWSAVIAGDGDVEGVQEEVARRDLGCVRVVGWLDAQAVETALSEASIFVLPSRDEGLPVALLQAMAHGLAVVTTPVGSIPEVIQDGVNGLLVPVDDAGALQAALRRLLLDRELLGAIGRAARRDWEDRYTPDKWVRSLVSIYGCCARGGAARP